MQIRSRTAGFWIAIILVASLIPCAPIAICVVDLAFSAFVVDVPVNAISRIEVVSNDQPLSLLSVALFRGPPSLGSLV